MPNPNFFHADWHEVSDNPELTDDELARMRPGPKGLPDAMAAAFRSRGGRPRSETKRVPVSLRIDPDVLAAFKATGAGWQTRMNDALADAAKRLSSTRIRSQGSALDPRKDPSFRNPN